MVVVMVRDRMVTTYTVGQVLVTSEGGAAYEVCGVKGKRQRAGAMAIGVAIRMTTDSVMISGVGLNFDCSVHDSLELPINFHSLNNMTGVS
jgi:hypothetical protein